MQHKYNIFDRELLKVKRAKILPILPKADFLIKRSFSDLSEKITEQGREFSRIMVLGTSNLNQREYFHKKETIFHSSISPALGDIFCDEEDLNFPFEEFDLVVSILNLHNINDLPGFFARIRGSLKKDGIFIGSLFGEDNLIELKDSMLKAELELNKGASPRTMPVITIKQLGSLINRAGFDSVIIDNDKVKVHYAHPLKLLYDLRNMGETNILVNQNKLNPGKNFWQKVSENYFKFYSSVENEIVASFDIINITAYK